VEIVVDLHPMGLLYGLTYWNEMFLPSPVVVLLTLNALAGFPVGLEFPL